MFSQILIVFAFVSLALAGHHSSNPPATSDKGPVFSEEDWARAACQCMNDFMPGGKWAPKTPATVEVPLAASPALPSPASNKVSNEMAASTSDFEYLFERR
jgi:hypothetical protein